MVRFVITIRAEEDEINVHVSRDGKYFDEVSFNRDELTELKSYLIYLSRLITINIRSKGKK